MNAEMNPYGMMMTGPNLRAEIAMFAMRNEEGLVDILVKVTGGPAFTAGIDNVVLKCSAHANRGEVIYSYNMGGSSHPILRTSNGWDSAVLTLGGQSYPLRTETGLSPDAKPAHLLSEYTKRLGDAPGRLAIERKLKGLETEMQGKWAGKLSLQWNGKNEDAEAAATMFAVVSGLDTALKALLLDEMGRTALSAFSELELDVQPGTAIEVAKNGKTLQLKIGKGYGAGNMGSAIQRILEENL